MTGPDISDIRTRLVAVVERRVGSGEDAPAVASAIYRDLAVVLVPLVSEAGFDALVGRAFQLAQRQFPAAQAQGDIENDVELLVRIGLWLDRQDEGNRIGAMAAMFAAVAELLVTLIGDSLTTRYLRKVWPDGVSGGRSKGKQT